MKKRIISSLLTLGMVSVPQFACANLLNGDFENGLTDWTTVVAGSANPVTLATGTSNTPAGVINPSLTNDQYIYTSQNGQGHSIIAQDFTVASRANKVFFDFAYINITGAFYTPATLDYTGAANQHARFDILKASSAFDSMNAGDIIITAFVTNPGDALSQDWQTKEIDVTAALANYVGQNVTFRFSQVDNQGLFTFALDNINIGFSQIPVLISVFDSSQARLNSPAYGAASVIDNTPELLLLFIASGLTSDENISAAASQTLPLLTGGVSLATGDALNSINRVIQSRITSNIGLSAGDTYQVDHNIWVSPFGSWVDQDDEGDLAGYEADTAGVIFGYDRVSFDNSIRLGAAFAYADADIESNSHIAPQSADVDIYQLITYGSYSFSDQTELNFQADYGQNKNDGKRVIPFTSTTASSDYDSETFHLGTGIGITYPINKNTHITPSVRVDYTNIKDDSYTETGAGILNLNVNDQRFEALVFSISGKFTHKLNVKSTITANLGASEDSINDGYVINAAYAGAPSSSFKTQGLEPESWTVDAGLGYVYHADNGLEFTVKYDASFRDDYLNQNSSVKLRWSF